MSMNPSHPQRTRLSKKVPNLFKDGTPIPILHSLQAKPPFSIWKTNFIPSNSYTTPASTFPLPKIMIELIEVMLYSFNHFLRQDEDIRPILYKIDWINCKVCNLQANERCFADQVWILTPILSIRGWQSLYFCLPDIRGIPRYLTGRLHSLNWRHVRIRSLISPGTAAKKISLLLGLRAKPDISWNSSRANLIRRIEGIWKKQEIIGKTKVSDLRLLTLRMILKISELKNFFSSISKWNPPSQSQTNMEKLDPLASNLYPLKITHKAAIKSNGEPRICNTFLNPIHELRRATSC